MKRFALLFALFLFQIQPVNAQQFQETDPSTIGLLPDRLDRIDTTILKSIKNGEIPGAVALIARNGQIGYHKSFGYADIDSKTKMQNESIFRIASMTKAVTTVGIMVLYERGHFKLSDAISKYIPEFRKPSVLVKADSLGNIAETKPAKREIRILDLLTHTSGISYPFTKDKLSKVYAKEAIIDGLTSQNQILKDQMLKLAKMPLLFEPRESYKYSLSIDLLGYLCEVISGKPLDVFFAEEIFKPLKMNDTYFYLPDSKSKRLVTLYAAKRGSALQPSKGDESSIVLDNPNYPIEGAKTYFSGGGGLSSTAYDYARFTQMLLNEGTLEGTRVLSRKSVERMRHPRIDSNKDGNLNQGFGFSIVDLSRSTEVGSDGAYAWGGAFYTSYWIDPKENLIAVFMSQLRPSRTDIATKFRSMVYQSLE